MNKDQIKGKIEDVKGDVKERIGGATKDRQTQGEGMLEQAKGKVRGKYGDLKEGAKRDEEGAKRDEPTE